MGVTVRTSAGPITEEIIDRIETDIGTRLPEDYREFLLAHNAKEISPCSFPVSGISGTSTVTLREMCCYCPGQACDIEYTLESYENRFPAGFFPIAEDPGGNVFLIQVEGQGRGSIYFWIHEFEGDEDEQPTMDNMVFLSSSFSQLLDELAD